ncbi:hypothetical protein LEQ03_01870 [Riemerella anatipestifer]|nr:hypothetical protein LEQ03_13440 [Riemerella anatipestifer]WPC13461.1 hypothetical protein LEQ03_01870 [Riemerella anatipestifer]
MTAKEKMELAEKVHNLTTDGVDDDYFYEEFGLPRGKKIQAEAQEPNTEEVEESEETEETKEENKVQNPKEKTPKKKKVQAKELSLFEKLKDFSPTLLGRFLSIRGAGLGSIRTGVSKLLRAFVA